MFERFTEKARRVIFFARYEAQESGVPAIETEHLLLGIARDDHATLEHFVGAGLRVSEIRPEIESRRSRREAQGKSVDLPLSDASKRAMKRGMEEADALGHQQIGTVHLLLGILRQEEGLGAVILKEKRADAERIRKRLRDEGEPQPGKGDSRDNAGDSVTGLKTKLSSMIAGSEVLRRSGFERYNERARRAIFFARYDCNQFHAPKIDTEHLLLGVMRELDRDRLLYLPAAFSHEWVLAEIKRRGPRYEATLTQVDLPLSEGTKRALANAAEQAQAMKTAKIGLGHLLLGLLREEKSMAAAILSSGGADSEQIRKAELKRDDKSDEGEESDPPRGDFGEYT